MFSDNYVSSDLRKNLTQIKADLEGKNEILNWQIATCKKAKSNKNGSKQRELHYCMAKMLNLRRFGWVWAILLLKTYIGHQNRTFWRQTSDFTLF